MKDDTRVVITMVSLTIIGIVLVVFHPIFVRLTLDAFRYSLKKRGYSAEKRSDIANRKAFLIALAFIYALFLILIIISFLVGYFPIILKQPQSVWDNLGIALMSVVCGVAVYFFLSTFLLFIEKLKPSAAASDYLKESSARLEVMKGFSQLRTLPVVIFINFCEEFIWRGYMITALRLEAQLSPMAALLISALAFGSMHYYGGIQKSVIPQIVHGILLGILFVYTQTLLASFLCHITYNVLSIRRIRRLVKEFSSVET